ncbi:twin-arginine translocation pathway signal [Mycolicibacterium sp. 3033]|nr:twin-arginine translocation pathway signal [Mycolicibacterium aurantiacum]
MSDDSRDALDDHPIDEALADDHSETTEQPSDDAHSAPRRGFIRRYWLGALLIVLPVAATAVAAVLYVTQYRPESQTNQAVSDVIKAASDGTTALLTYSPASVEADTAHAKTLLTGQFLDYYTQFTANVIIPAAKKKEVETGAQVARSGIVEIHPDKAVVLVFVNQTSSSADRPEPANSASAVRVTMERQQGRWLISSFDPV